MKNSYLPFKMIAGFFLLAPVIALLFIPERDRLRPVVVFPFTMLFVMGTFLFLLTVYYITWEKQEKARAEHDGY